MQQAAAHFASEDDEERGEHHASGEHPRKGIDRHEDAEARPYGADGKHPYHAEHTGAEDGVERGHERTPHGPERGTRDFITTGQPLPDEGCLHTFQSELMDKRVGTEKVEKEIALPGDADIGQPTRQHGHSHADEEDASHAVHAARTVVLADEGDGSTVEGRHDIVAIVFEILGG